MLLRYRGRGGNRGKLVSLFEGGGEVKVKKGHYPFLGYGCNGRKNGNPPWSGTGSGKDKGRRRGKMSEAIILALKHRIPSELRS